MEANANIYIYIYTLLEEVSNANDFVKDTEALEAIREAIAQEAQVSTDAVVIISVTIVQDAPGE